MARAPDPRIEQAKERYLAGEKLTEIARQLGLPEGTVRRWKCTHKWDRTDSERSDRVGDKQRERSDRNEKKEKRKRGAQPGNKNSSGGPPGNKKAITTGEFETLLFDCLKEEELRLVASTPKDKHRLLLQEIQLISVRERRMLRRIEDIKESLEYLGRNGSEEGLTLVMVEDGEKGINKKYEGKLGQIQSIEEALTRVQAKKQRMIEALHKFGYDDAYMKLQLKRLEQDKTDSKIDAVKVWAEKVLEARREKSEG